MFRVPLLRRDGPALRGPRTLLRLPAARDYAEWAALRHSSRAFLEPWEPRWLADELERHAWKQRLRRYAIDFREGAGVTFFIFETPGMALAGGITLGNIKRGVSQSGQIGYWMGERFAGKGLMGEALRLVTGFAFDSLRLHRLEAACIPDNTRSIRLLEKAGFAREGLLRSYLRINGTWQDHYLYALIADEHRADTIRD